MIPLHSSSITAAKSAVSQVLGQLRDCKDRLLLSIFG